MATYNMTVPMWFCPARTEEFQNANDWFRQNYNRDIATVADLNVYYASFTGSFLLISHGWWNAERASRAGGERKRKRPELQPEL